MYVFLVVLFMMAAASSGLQAPILELSGAVVEMYKNPQDCRSEFLMEAAKDYLYHLVKLKQAARTDQPGSVQALKEVYLEGNPPFHLRNIPWEKFIEVYKWSPTNMSAYHDIIVETRKVWQECLAELEKHKDPNLIL